MLAALLAAATIPVQVAAVPAVPAVPAGPLVGAVQVVPAVWAVAAVLAVSAEPAEPAVPAESVGAVQAVHAEPAVTAVHAVADAAPGQLWHALSCRLTAVGVLWLLKQREGQQGQQAGVAGQGCGQQPWQGRCPQLPCVSAGLPGPCFLVENSCTISNGLTSKTPFVCWQQCSCDECCGSTAQQSYRFNLKV